MATLGEERHLLAADNERLALHEDLADVIADRLSKVPAVVHTTTHIAFRAYSQHDLDAAFSLGFEQ